MKKNTQENTPLDFPRQPLKGLHCACVPVAPGWSRLILANASRGGQDGGVVGVYQEHPKP